jgi:hypothetical protein
MVHQGLPRFCEKCGYQFASDPRANLAPQKGLKPGTKLLGCFGLLLVVLILITVFNNIPTSHPSSRATNDAHPVATPTEPTEPPLELVSYSWHIEYGYAILEGQVKNISAQPLKSVEAVASFYDSAGGFITSADSLIAYNPILPGQTSPFKVMATENPAMKKAGVEFKELFGGTIPFRKAESKRSKKN